MDSTLQTIVDSILALRANSFSAPFAPYGGKEASFTPFCFAILGDDPGHRQLFHMAGWKTLSARARYFADLPWVPPPADVSRSAMDDSEMPPKASRRTLRQSTDLEIAFAMHDTLFPQSTSGLPIPATDPTARRNLLKPIYQKAALKVTDIYNLKPTPLWQLPELRDDFYLCFAPCLLHNWNLGIVKWLFRQVGRRFGTSYMSEMNHFLSVSSSSEYARPLNIPNSIRRPIYSTKEKDCLAMKGTLWSELLKVGAPVVRAVVSLFRNAGWADKADKDWIGGRIDTEVEEHCRYLTLAAKIQDLLYSDRFLPGDVKQLEELIFELKCQLIRTLKPVIRDTGQFSPKKPKQPKHSEDSTPSSAATSSNSHNFVPSNDDAEDEETVNTEGEADKEEELELDTNFDFPNWETRT